MRDAMETKSTKKIKIFCVALSPKVQGFISQKFRDIEMISVTSIEDFEESWENLDFNSFDLALCGCELGVNFPLEVGQLFSNEMPQAPIFFIADKKKAVRIEELTKNGFSEVFIYPLDSSFLIEKLSEYIGGGLGDEVMRPVSLIDIQNTTALKFDVFALLPLNKKFIRIAKKDNGLSDRQIKKLKEYNYKSLFVKANEYTLYTEDIKDNLNQILVNSSDPDNIESQKILRQSVRTLFLSLFDVESEEKNDPVLAIEDCQDVVFNFINNNSKNDLLSGFRHFSSTSEDYYENSRLQATLVGLLGTCLKIDNLKCLVIACLLKDVALWNIEPGTISELPLEKNENYLRHPKESLKIARTKIIGISDLSQTYILTHHERYDGKGFPEGLSGNDVLEGAQLLNFVDKLFELTTVKIGQKSFDLEAAIKQIENSGILMPHFELKIFNLLRGGDEDSTQSHAA